MKGKEAASVKIERGLSMPQSRLRPLRRQLVPFWLLCFSTISYSFLKISFAEPRSSVGKVQQCTVRNLHKDTSFLDRAKPITADEFIQRRDDLAKAIHSSGADAFVLEPGYTFQYYGNISQQDWEPWEPEERPFLMIVQPTQTANREIVAKTSFLAPHFEEGRVRMLGIPAREKELDIVVWEEHWSPYETLKDKLFSGVYGQVLMVDDEMRDYIVRGLSATGFTTIGLSKDVEAVRQTKSPAEVDLLKAVNTGTVAALRAMRPCLRPGLTEDEVIMILDNALLSLGFSRFFDIVLFDENAALPHGGFMTGDKVLTYDTMVLIDVGARYYSYSSDVTRSFFIDRPKPSSRLSWLLSQVLHSPLNTQVLHDDPLHQQKVDVWKIVHRAQAAARARFKPNNTAASVDLAARGVITSEGYGDWFTHRLGHGIGIKAHESPYLNKGNVDTILREGMTFTDEPGIYITSKFGVRLEDVYLVRTNGEAENLSGGEATSPWEP